PSTVTRHTSRLTVTAGGPTSRKLILQAGPVRPSGGGADLAEGAVNGCGATGMSPGVSSRTWGLSGVVTTVIPHVGVEPSVGSLAYAAPTANDPLADCTPKPKRSRYGSPPARQRSTPRSRKPAGVRSIPQAQVGR